MANRKNGIPPGASAPSTGNDHLSPPTLLAALGALVRTDDGWALSTDPFDLDPCASMRQPWPTARTMHTEDADGMARAWEGEAFVNPPYGAEMPAWAARLAAHGSGVALLYARTDTNAFDQHVWRRADAVYFFRQRPFFHAPVTGVQYPNNSGGPMCCVAYGAKSVERLKRLLRPDSPYPGNLVPILHEARRNVVRVAPGPKKRSPRKAR